MSEIRYLNSKKSDTSIGFPTNHLQEVGEIIYVQLSQIWKEEIIQNNKFPIKLKLADITPIYKKLQNIFAEN